MNFLKFRQYLQKNLLHTSSTISNKKKCLKNYDKELKNVSFATELVSNASFNCNPNNSLSSLTNFLPEQIHVKGAWEVAISDLSYPFLYQNITEGKVTFIDVRENS